MPFDSIGEKKSGLPERSDYIAWFEFVQMCDIHPSRLGELIEMGWLTPVLTSGDEYLFRVRDVYRVSKLVRLCRDFDMGCLAASIIVDLLQRIEDLENKVAQLSRLL